METNKYKLHIGQKVYCNKDFWYNHQWMIGDEFEITGFNKIKTNVKLKTKINTQLIMRAKNISKWDKQPFDEYFDVNQIKDCESQNYEEWIEE